MVDEMLDGSVYGVFIDDTGSDGLRDPPPNLRPGRRSWVAVVVPPESLRTVLPELSEYVGLLRRLTLASDAEFHFSDIYAGKGAFSGVSFKSRWNLFRLFVGIFQKYQFKMLVRTIDAQSLAVMRQSPDFPSRRGAFDLRQPAEAALAAILGRVDQHLMDVRAKHDVRARVFVDEGLRKSGFGLWLKVFEPTFVDGMVWFANSRHLFPLQLADFGAFCMNRTQLLVGREKRSSRDVEFLALVRPLARLFHNLEYREVSGSAVRGTGRLL